MKTLLAPLLFATSLLGQPSEVRLPDESAGIEGIARTLISVFDQADIIALGEAHQRKLDSDLRIAVVRHPYFAKKVPSRRAQQSAAQRFLRGSCRPARRPCPLHPLHAQTRRA